MKINSPWTIEITLSDHFPVPSYLEQDALDVLSHVTRLREACGVGDDQRYVDELRERLHQQSLTATRRSDDDDVALVQLAILHLRPDIVVRIRDGPPRGRVVVVVVVDARSFAERRGSGGRRRRGRRVVVVDGGRGGGGPPELVQP